MNLPQTDTSTLALLVAQKRELLAQMEALGRRQVEFIDGDAMDQLLKLLANKQRVLSALQAVERRLDPFRDQRPEERRWPSAADRARCAADLAECERLLAAIVACEKLCEARLARQRAAAAERLRGLQHAAVARGAYVEREPVAAAHLDLSSGD